MTRFARKAAPQGSESMRASIAKSLPVCRADCRCCLLMEDGDEVLEEDDPDPAILLS